MDKVSINNMKEAIFSNCDRITKHQIESYVETLASEALKVDDLNKEIILTSFNLEFQINVNKELHAEVMKTLDDAEIGKALKLLDKTENQGSLKILMDWYVKQEEGN